jgi:hypothetical protein
MKINLSLETCYALKCICIKLQFYDFALKYTFLEKELGHTVEYVKFSNWKDQIKNYYNEISFSDLINFHKNSFNDENLMIECLEISNNISDFSKLSSKITHTSAPPGVVGVNEIRKEFIKFMRKEERNIKLNSILNYD